jgi:hypothetical protein
LRRFVLVVSRLLNPPAVLLLLAAASCSSGVTGMVAVNAPSAAAMLVPSRDEELKGFCGYLDLRLDELRTGIVDPKFLC